MNVASPFDKLRANGDPAYVTVIPASTTNGRARVPERR
jgi:hypothetical protein